MKKIINIDQLKDIQIRLLNELDSYCKNNGLNYFLAFGSLLGAIRHKGYIPWDDDIDIAMMRSDYEKFLDVVPGELPPEFVTTSLLPGALPPKEMTFNVGNGNRLNTSPEFLERFHGCPYATGVDVFVFDRVPDDPEEFKYQDRLIRLLDRMLMLQWEVNDSSITQERKSEYDGIKRTIEEELAYTFNSQEPYTTQILRMLDLACGLCDDCGSKHVENREQVIYYGEKGFREDFFTDRVFVPFENVMDVPIPRDYETALKNVFGNYKIPTKFSSQHDYPIYHNQRDALYKAYKDRGWKVPEEFLEYDENGKLIVDPNTI